MTMSNLPDDQEYWEIWSSFIKNYKGRSLLKDLCKCISATTGVSYVLIGYPDNAEMSHIRTAVLYADGKFVNDYSYPLGGTPCENVVGRSCCYYPSNIQQMFPNDAELKHLGIESYIGLPVLASDGKPLGLIALMDKKLIQNPGKIEAGLKSIAPMVTRELGKTIKRRLQRLAILN
jgi:hypothetical protein